MPKSRNAKHICQNFVECTRSATGGASIESSVLGPMEEKFDQDFSDVRVQRNITRAQNEGALAFTTGNKIILGEQAPDLHAVERKLLLAHELTHVLQFSESQRRGLKPNGRSSSSDPAELQAHSMAQKVGQGHCVASTPIQAASSAIHALDISPVESITAYLPDEAEFARQPTHFLPRTVDARRGFTHR